MCRLLGDCAKLTSRSHRLQDSRCSGLSFSDSGNYLASSHGNGVISVYSGETGAKAGEFHSQEFGCRLITYTVSAPRRARQHHVHMNLPAVECA